MLTYILVNNFIHLIFINMDEHDILYIICHYIAFGFIHFKIKLFKFEQGNNKQKSTLHLVHAVWPIIVLYLIISMNRCYVFCDQYVRKW